MTIALLMSVIAFCKNETSSILLYICLPALQGDDYASGKREEEEKKRYSHFLSLSFIRQKPRHRQAQRTSKIRRLSPRIHALVVNVAHKGKVTANLPGSGGVSQSAQGCSIVQAHCQVFAIVSKQLLQIPRRFRLE